MIEFSNIPPGAEILELGCGNNPHPQTTVRVDLFPGPGVSFTADLNEPIPVDSNYFHAVYSSFAIERLKFQNVRSFVKEVFRALKPGGKALIITANTHAQFDWALKNQNGWDGQPYFESASLKVFGDHNRPGQGHMNFMCPETAREIFSQAGFINLDIRPYGARNTDMLIVADKPQEGAPVVIQSMQTTQVGKYQMQLYPAARDCVTPIIAQGKYEQFETGVLSMIVREGDTVLDVGAHIGFYTLLFADKVGPNGHVVAFEPDATNREYLVKNLELNNLKDRVDIKPVALMDYSGKTKLYPAPNNTGDNRTWECENRVGKEVDCMRLDDALLPESKVNLIKIDVQGAEVKALKGMHNLVKAQERLIIALEFWPFGLNHSGDSVEELANLLKDFKIYHLDEDCDRHHSKNTLTYVGSLQEVASKLKHPIDYTNLVCFKG